MLYTILSRMDRRAWFFAPSSTSGDLRTFSTSRVFCRKKEISGADVVPVSASAKAKIEAAGGSVA